MYGDCQVMSSMMSGAPPSVVSTDSLFSSPIRNPNHNHHPMGFMTNLPFHSFPSLVPKEETGMMMMMGMVGSSSRSKEEEMESGSGSGHVDGTSCGEEHDNGGEASLQEHRNQQQQQPEQKRKRYHRHTARQIQEMEALFKECPHPDDKQRMRLSHDLGLKPRQVKFWFQNRRTQMKAQQDRSDNVMLRAENENLKNENFRLQAAVRNIICPSCGSPAVLGEMSFDEQHLRLENARLKDELERLSCIASRYTSRPLQSLGPAPPLMLPSLDLDMNIYSRHFTEPSVMGGGCTDLVPVAPPIADNGGHPLAIIMDQDKGLAMDLAMTAAEQLMRLCSVDEPLWVKRGTTEVLDLEEYGRLFQWPVDFKQQGGEFRTEATRDAGILMMNSVSLVDAFLDANKWMELFPSVVSKAKTLQIISDGISGHGNGSLHLMYAELQVLSPLVPTREAHFLRYCQQNAIDGTWMIVDFPVDGFHDGLQMPLSRYRRRPSGCIIQDMPNGYARVVWVEHVDVEDKPVHQVFNQLVSSGAAFGATRWLSILQRQCERHATLMARNIPDLGVIPSPEGKKSMMKLSQRMVKAFVSSITLANNQSWTALSESSDDTIRVTTRKNTEPGQPNGVILTGVSTTWLPFGHHQVFDLLTDVQRRPQLDALFNGSSMNEVAHIANGSHHRNCVSLLRMNATSNSSPELFLQESSTHPSGGSIVVYASIDVEAAHVVLSGEDPSYVPLLPIGLVMVPAPSPAFSSGAADGNNNIGDGLAVGCLLTVGMQILASTVPSAKLSLSNITAINTHLCNTVSQITALLGGGNTNGDDGSGARPDAVDAAPAASEQ